MKANIFGSKKKKKESNKQFFIYLKPKIDLKSLFFYYVPGLKWDEFYNLSQNVFIVFTLK